MSSSIFRFCFIRGTDQPTVTGVPVVGTPVTVCEQTFTAQGPVDNDLTSRGSQDKLLTLKSLILTGKIKF